MPDAPTDLVGAAQVLIENGCQKQLDLLVESASKAENELGDHSFGLKPLDVVGVIPRLASTSSVCSPSAGGGRSASARAPSSRTGEPTSGTPADRPHHLPMLCLNVRQGLGDPVDRSRRNACCLELLEPFRGRLLADALANQAERSPPRLATRAPLVAKRSSLVHSG